MIASEGSGGTIRPWTSNDVGAPALLRWKDEREHSTWRSASERVSTSLDSAVG
jgi:hypothetical protein